MKTALEQTEDKTTRQQRQSADPQVDPQAIGAREQQHGLSQRIAAGPAMTSQRKAIDRIIAKAEPVQKQSTPEEEELMQGKFTAQRQIPEDEEILQGAFEAGAPRTGTRDSDR